MSPLKPIVIRTQRGFAVLTLVSLLVLPAAGWIAGSRLARQDEKTDRIAALARQIQEERKYASVQSCLRESARNEAILTYLRSLGADEKDLGKARPFFPVLKAEQCEMRAKKTVSSPRPR